MEELTLCRTNDEGLEGIATACPNLRELTIDDGQFGDRGVKALRACRKLAHFHGYLLEGFQLSHEVRQNVPCDCPHGFMCACSDDEL